MSKRSALALCLFIGLICPDRAPGQPIPMFSVSLDHETYVWCIDVSDSMGSSSVLGVALEAVQAEVENSIAALDPLQSFSVVAFNAGPTEFSATPVPGTATEIAAAQSWVQGLLPSGPSCVPAGVIDALQIAGLTSLDPCVILVSDGAPSCGATSEALADIVSANFAGTPIHAFFIDTGASDGSFMEQIALQTGGTFLAVPSGPDAFRRGDANDDSMVDLSDVIFLLSYGFVPLSPPPTCFDAADADDDGDVDVLADSVRILQGLFIPGSPPLPEPLSCGWDPTLDPIVCTTGCP